MMQIKFSPKKYLILLICTYFVSNIYTQNLIHGVVFEKDRAIPIVGAVVSIGSKGTITDTDGKFSLEKEVNQNYMVVSFTGFKKTRILLSESNEYNIQLEEESVLLQTTIISSSRFETSIAQSSVSMEVIAAKDIDKLSTNSVEQVLDRVPGVQILDGQANIRGGSGYSYGAGSRVMLVMDEIPILQPDAGFPNWSDLPLENVDQIEVLKGAASALYGSAAMNGVIHFRSKFPGSKPFTSVTQTMKYFTAPDQEEYWWKNNSFKDSPQEWITTIVDRRKIKSWDLSSALAYTNKNEYNENVGNINHRANVLIRKRFKDKMTASLGANLNTGTSSDFFYWKASGLYTGDTSSFTRSKKVRFSLDPSVNYITNKNYKHKAYARWYYIENNNNANQSNQSNNYYGEYQIHKNIEKWRLAIAAGVFGSYSKIDAPLYGDTLLSSSNQAVYLSAEHKIKDRLIIMAGMRYEYFKIQGPSHIGTYQFDQQSKDSRPVFRFGLNYNVAKNSYLRASWGQGFRFPTLAEKYIQTQAGNLNIAPNPNLKSEYGNSFEIGYKQAFKFLSMDGGFDIAGFYSKYQDMMEFGFLLSPNLVPFFQSSNVGDTEIPGVEGSLLLNKKFKYGNLSFIASHTFIEPKFQDWDLTGNNVKLTELDKATRGQLNALRSTSDENVLKYRSKHVFKSDIQYQLNGWMLGYDFLYASNVTAIDPIFETFIKGVKEFREKNNTGYRIHGVRLAYQLKKIELQANLFNLTNKIYTNRPGYLEAPRHMVFRATYKINS